MKQQCKICEGTGFYGGGKTECVICNGTGSVNPITGEDVAALLHGIHDHAELIQLRVKHAKKQRKNKVISEMDLENVKGKIYYSEEDLLPILEALGLPAPVWGKSMSVEEWKKSKK